MGRIIKLIMLVVLATCLFVASAFAANSKNNKPRVVEGEFIVKFREGVTQQQIDTVKSSLGISHVAHIVDNKKLKNKNKIKTAKLQQWKKVKLDKKKNNKAVLSDLNRNPLIEYAEPNYYYSFESVPNDPDFSRLWGLHNTGQLNTGGGIDSDIDAPEAWGLNTGDATPIVAVIDTGVDYNHEDLAANMWINSAEIANNGIDDDNNGYVDDIYGYDFADLDSDPIDYDYHGTHVAGTIAAVGNNGLGVTGVSWNARIMAVKFFGSGTGGNTDVAIASILYAIDNGANIINASWGGTGYSQALKDVIQTAGDAGVLFVAAAGNNGLNADINPNYPAAYDLNNIISVAATDSFDDIAPFSSYGNRSVDLGAPGVSVYSTMPNNTYGILSGTSMASPHVAGAAAVLLSNYPDLSPNFLKLLVMSTADQLPSMVGKTVSNGRLNLFNSLTCDSTNSESLGYLNLLPLPGTTALPNSDPVNINILITQCSDVVPNEAVSVTFDNGESPLTLFDDGLHDDGDAGDGLYGNSWIPQVEGSVQLVITLERDGQVNEVATIPMDVRVPFYTSEQIDYRWIDTSNGQSVSLSDDSFQTFDIPNFSFYGTEYNRLTTSSNGFLSFSEEGGAVYSNSPLPLLSVPNNIIAPFWDDLNPLYGGQVLLLTEGVAPYRRITVSWNDIRHFGSTADGISMQASLYETSGDIVFQYKDVFFNDTYYDYGVSATVGTENNSGTDGLQIAYNETALTDLSAYRIYHTDGNRIPFIHQIGDRSVQAGDTLTFDVIVTVLDGDLVTLTMASNSLPVNADYVDNDDGTGTFTWTPEVSDVGLYSDITFTATDAEDVVNQTITIEVAEQPRAPVEIRVNAGGGEYTDGNGKIWSADYGFNTGASGSPFRPIIGTNDQPLFDNNRYNLSTSPELMYNFTVPNADYVVNLYFSETYTPVAGTGLRVFDVAMEGAVVWNNIDVFTEAQDEVTMLVKQNVITVADGELNIEFLHDLADHPMISAIEILEVSSTEDIIPPTIPSNVLAEPLDQNSIRLSWDPSTDIGGTVAGYNIYRNGEFLFTVTDRTYLNHGGLLPGATHTYTVTAFDDAEVPNESAHSVAVSVTTLPEDIQPPTVPNNLRSSTSIEADHIVYLRWDASTDLGGGNVAGYNIYRDGNPIPIASTTNTLYTDTGLTANTTYNYTVTAFDDATPPNESAPASTSITTRIVAPGNFNAIAVNSNQIDLSWTLPQGINVTDITGYRIFRELVRGHGMRIGDVSAATTSFSDTGNLNPETTYYYGVYAYGDSLPENTSMWAVTEVTTLPIVDTLPPTIPRNLVANVISDSQIDLSWDPSIDQGGGVVSGYTIRVKYIGVLTTVTGTSFSHTGLEANTTYEYVIHAFDNAVPPNTSDMTWPAVSATTLPSETTQTTIRVNAGGTEYVDGAGNVWSADYGYNTGGVGSPLKSIRDTANQPLFDRNRYDVHPLPELMYSFDVPNGNYQVILYFAETYTPLYGNGLRVFDVEMEGLPAWTNLDVFAEAGGAEVMLVKNNAVNVVDGQLNIEFLHGLANHPMVSAIEIIQTGGSDGGSDTQAPSTPSNVNAIAISAYEIDLTWAASTDLGGGEVSHYEIYRDEDFIGEAFGTNYFDIELIPDTSYSYTILAVDNAVVPNRSLHSSPISATTLVEGPYDPPSLMPTGLSATAISANQIDLTWTASTDLGVVVAGYHIYRDGNSTPLATVIGTSYSDTGLIANSTYTYTVSAFDDANPVNESVQTSPVIATTLDVGSVAIRLNAGGGEYSDGLGQIWSADTGFNTGGAGSPFKSIAGTADQPLFDNNRYDVHPLPELMYSFDVPNGGYQVNLYFAETYTPLYGNGLRVFDVEMEGSTVWTNLDVFSETGAAETMLMKQNTVTVLDGQLNIEFLHGLANHPMVSAIEIVQVSGGGSDTQAPSTPADISATAISTSQIDLSWSASTDFGGGSVAGYRIYRDGNPIAVVGGTSYSDFGLVANTSYNYTVTAYDNASPSNESLESVIASATTFDTTLVSIRVNAGGGQYTDGLGQVWSADYNFNTGGAGSPNKSIVGTTNQPLFDRNRYDVHPLPELMYSFDVPNGDYQVTLYFAETYTPLYGNGLRVFDVAMEGNAVWNNLDVYAEAGNAETMLVKQNSLSVSDGQLNIEFLHGLANHPMVSAIVIVQY